MKKQYTQDQIVEMLTASPSLQRAQLLADGLARVMAGTHTPMTIGMIAWAHLLVEPLARSEFPLGADGKPDTSKKPIMLYNLPHEQILRDALTLYLAKQSAIVAAKDHGIDLNEVTAFGGPGKCACGVAISANKTQCLECAGKDAIQ